MSPSLASPEMVISAKAAPPTRARAVVAVNNLFISFSSKSSCRLCGPNGNCNTTYPAARARAHYTCPTGKRNAVGNIPGTCCGNATGRPGRARRAKGPTRWRRSPRDAAAALPSIATRARLRVPYFRSGGIGPFRLPMDGRHARFRDQGKPRMVRLPATKAPIAAPFKGKERPKPLPPGFR